MITGAQSRCDLCGHEVACLDEQNRCEQCVLRAEWLAAELFATLEEFIRFGLESGLTEQQLREAFELSLAGGEGEIPDLSLRRQPVVAEERALWLVAPYSAWL